MYHLDREIYDAIRIGSILETVELDEATGRVGYEDTCITENTRVAYPRRYIPNNRITAKAEHHAKQIILLTGDALGVLPPITKLTRDQATYRFISGFTAKVAGTEDHLERRPEA